MVHEILIQRRGGDARDVYRRAPEPQATCLGRHPDEVVLETVAIGRPRGSDPDRRPVAQNGIGIEVGWVGWFGHYVWTLPGMSRQSYWLVKSTSIRM